MPYFTKAKDVYETLGALAWEICRSRGVGARVAQAATDVQIDLSEPSARITVHAREGPRVDFGGAAIASGLFVKCSADTAHELALGKIGVAWAIERGEISLAGPVNNIAPAWVAGAFAAPVQYAAMLRRDGREELVVA